MRLAAFSFAFVYILMLLVIFILPSFSSEGYSIISNSLSELGAQATPNNWIMNAILIALSLVTAFLATKKLGRFWMPLYLLYFFSLALFLTAFYQHAPITNATFLEREHLTHSVFSMITGTAFCAYCIAVVFIIKRNIEKASAIFMCAIAVALSLLMLEFPEYRGVFQRILFISAFGWLFYSLITFKFEKTSKSR
ncbi:MAG: DUF998 domain-containing protein [Flavobacteriaceae bacterium]|nr:DUF998 domain-containing protein [Flavobacteriaceae bacterium]